MANKPFHILLSSPHYFFFSGRKLQLTSGNWSLHIILKQLYWNGKQCFQERADNRVEHKAPFKTDRGGQFALHRNWPNFLPMKLQLIIARKPSKVTSASTQRVEDRPESGRHTQKGLPHLGSTGTCPLTRDPQTPKYQNGLCGPKSGHTKTTSTESRIL